MARRYEVTDEQWRIIEPHLGNKAKRMGRPQADNRKLFNGVRWILRTGTPWRDFPSITDHGRLWINVLLNGRRMENSRHCLTNFEKVQTCKTYV